MSAPERPELRARDLPAWPPADWRAGGRWTYTTRDGRRRALVRCRLCNGRGKVVDYRRQAGGGCQRVPDRRCPACSGTGAEVRDW